MAIGVITMRKYLQVLFASEQQKYNLSAANRISLRIPKMTETPLTMEAVSGNFKNKNLNLSWV